MIVPVRLFDKASRMMLYPEQGTINGIFLSLMGEPVQLQPNGMPMRLKDMVVMHRTPHMANGKHIWEGDICTFDIPNDFGSVTPARGFMAWSQKHTKWNLDIVEPESAFTNGFYDVLLNVQIVGDLYTTPHLLKPNGNKIKVAN